MSKLRCRDLARLASTVPERQALYRRMRPSRHRGSRQFVSVMLSPLVPAVIALSLVSHWDSVALVALVGGLLVGTSAVYFGHRYPMHRVLPPLEIAYDHHTRCHHMIFNEGQTEITSIDDVDMIMLPTRHALGLCAVLIPLLTVPWLLLGLDAALVFAAVAWLYYLVYELVHLAAHLRVGGPLDSVPGLGWLLRHHRRHHAWALMHHGNFSMLIPLWDWALGTLLPPRRPGARVTASPSARPKPTTSE